MNPSIFRLYLVADPDHAVGDFLSTVDQALTGGVTMVQLRAKSLTDRELLALAIRLRQSCSRHGVPFIVNDRLDIALASGADGIHLGVHDFPIDVVRGLARRGFIIGYSPETDEHILTSGNHGADYLGVGPVFDTSTKIDAGSALGLGEFARRCSISPVPVVGIGGVDSGNAASVITAGASGVALVSAILRSPDPRAAARTVLDQVTMTVR
jgi:thiamine-phosphate diphosphorylase